MMSSRALHLTAPWMATLGLLALTGCSRSSGPAHAQSGLAARAQAQVTSLAVTG
ncbi:MAG: hypothetical protein JRI23_04525, partial [Deltaproteobacteria bacterium]|nr:hypothetical protein [Deltaproteobacteria bacterium]MBW2530813.1 hypothetical protein [Deltaproteobacteria bacterium]